MYHEDLFVQGKCSTQPPPYFNLTEPLPDGACAILVREDFLDVPVGTMRLWLDSLYVAIAQPGTSESSVLVLHVRPPPPASSQLNAG